MNGEEASLYGFMRRIRMECSSICRCIESGVIFPGTLDYIGGSGLFRGSGVLFPDQSEVVYVPDYSEGLGCSSRISH